MITKDDIKALKIHQTRQGKFARWLLLILPLCCLAMGFINLLLAFTLGAMVDLTIFQVFLGWANGIEAGVQYSEVYLKAMERTANAQLQIGFGIPLFILAYSSEKRRKLDARILEALTEAGVI